MSSSEETALRKYEDMLLGKAEFTMKSPHNLDRKEDSYGSLGHPAKQEQDTEISKVKEANALAVVRYAVSGILKWTPQEAMDCMTVEIAKQLRLDVIAKYVRYPNDLSRSKDYAWLIHRAFPDETTYDISREAVQLYDRVLRGELSRFPKRIFEGENGAKKLSILLRVYISNNIPSASVEELYDIFGDPAVGNARLHEAKLYYPCHESYETPLDYLNQALGTQNDDFLYNFYSYMIALKSVDADLRREEKDGEETKKEKKEKKKGKAHA